MENLQDVKVLNRDRNTVPLLELRSVLVVCTMPYGYKNKHNAASHLTNCGWFVMSFHVERTGRVPKFGSGVDGSGKSEDQSDSSLWSRSISGGSARISIVSFWQWSEYRWLAIATDARQAWGVRYRFAKFWLKLVLNQLHWQQGTKGLCFQQCSCCPGEWQATNIVVLEGWDPRATSYDGTHNGVLGVIVEAMVVAVLRMHWNSRGPWRILRLSHYQDTVFDFSGSI